MTSDLLTHGYTTFTLKMVTVVFNPRESTPTKFKTLL